MHERYELGQVGGKWVVWAFPSAVYYVVSNRAEAVERINALRGLSRQLGKGKKP